MSFLYLEGWNGLRAVAAISVWLLVNRLHILSIIGHQIIACVAVVLIISQVSNPKTIIRLKNPVLNYLGKISFGIYIYHPLVITIIGYIFIQNNMPISGIGGVVFMGLAIGCTLLAESISYACYESKFLALKEKYVVIPVISGIKAAA